MTSNHYSNHDTRPVEILDILESFTRNGASVLMSTHNFPLIKPRKKRFIELSDGRVIV